MSSPREPEQANTHENIHETASDDLQSAESEYSRSEALKKAIRKLKEKNEKSISDDEPSGVQGAEQSTDLSTKPPVNPEHQPPDHSADGTDSDAGYADSQLLLGTWEETQDTVPLDEWELPDDAVDQLSVPFVPMTTIESRSESTAISTRDSTPWTLQQFFDGEIDLDIELSRRFPSMPLLTKVKFRTLGTRSGRKVATVSASDGSSSLVIDADVETKVIQLSFTYGSMMTLRFSLNNLSDMDRTRWLELMQREEGGLAFLWGPSRWQNDYLICIARKQATNIYAFSPNNFESAVRLTLPATRELLAWIENIWTGSSSTPDDDSPLLTW